MLHRSLYLWAVAVSLVAYSEAFLSNAPPSIGQESISLAAPYRAISITAPERTRIGSSSSSSSNRSKRKHVSQNSSSASRKHGQLLMSSLNARLPDGGAERDSCTAMTRAGLFDAGLAAAAVALVGGASAGAAEDVASQPEPVITSKCFIEVRIMEPLNESNGYSSKNAYKGKLVFGLYGKACPKTAENFLRYVKANRSNGEPSYSAGLMTKMEPGVILEGGKIAGLNSINIGGQDQLQFAGEIITIPPLLENSSVQLSHDRKGLLTRPKLSRGPEFGVTLGPAPDLDGSYQVFGRLLQGEDVLERLQQVPVYGGSSILEDGSAAANAFKAQNRALVYLGKNVFKDTRAVDRTGMLMRRVDILNCGMM